MRSALRPCQMLTQQRKLGVMERTLNLEAEHTSGSRISTSYGFCDPGQVIQLLSTWISSLVTALPSSGKMTLGYSHLSSLARIRVYFFGGTYLNLSS